MSEPNCSATSLFSPSAQILEALYSEFMPFLLFLLLFTATTLDQGLIMVHVDDFNIGLRSLLSLSLSLPHPSPSCSYITSLGVSHLLLGGGEKLQLASKHLCTLFPLCVSPTIPFQNLDQDNVSIHAMPDIHKRPSCGCWFNTLS